MKRRDQFLAVLAAVLISAPRLPPQTQSNPQAKRNWSKEFQLVLQQNILQFWLDHAIDHQYGGMIGWLSRDGDPIPPGTKSLVQQSRVVWTFSAAYERYPKPAYKKAATKTLKFLREHMWDGDHHGFNWLVDRQGKVWTARRIFMARVSPSTRWRNTGGPFMTLRQAARPSNCFN